MGLFGKKKPKLGSYDSFGLEDLLRDPEWAYAISQAGIDVASCEVVLRLSRPSVPVNGMLESVHPAILLGQGDIVAIAYPGDREVQVVRRDKTRGELQTQRSGWFQIMFGHAGSLDCFAFWDGTDNLMLNTPEGDAFGPAMLAFMRDELRPQQVVGTPQTLLADTTSGSSTGPWDPPSLSFDDPQDALRWEALVGVRSSLDAMVEKNSECFEKAEAAERAFAIAEAEYVDGIRQHELSKESFRKMGEETDHELVALLHELRDLTIAARNQWNDLMFLLPNAENDVMKVANWCTEHNIDSEIFSHVVSRGAFVHTDFGLTRQSFWAENERVSAVMEGRGQ